jgi:energy-coupling factor transport system ATP-binding protein
LESLTPQAQAVLFPVSRSPVTSVGAAGHAVIEVEGLSYTYPGGMSALKELTLSIGSGERVAVIGANGSGKTTLARCLNGLIQPQAGSVVVDGLSTADPHALFDLRRRLGMVFQNPDDQLVAITLEGEIAFGLENLGIPTAEMRLRVEEVISSFRLGEYRRRPPHLLSGGEKQRLAIAACMALRPLYLVLDEPTALLDPAGRGEVAELLVELRRVQSAITIIHITQDPAEAAAADRVLVLDRGSLWMDAAPADVFGRGAGLRKIGLTLPFAGQLSLGIQHATGAPLETHLSLEFLAPALADLWHASIPARPCSPEPAPDRLASAGSAGTASMPPGRKIELADTGSAVDARPAKLVASDVWHFYDIGPGTSPVAALRGVTAEVLAGGVVALVGPSGSGKSTLAQHFNALLKPDRGQVLLDGEDIWAQPRDPTSVRRRVGLVFQFPELQLFDETVAGDIAFGPANLGRSDEEIDRLVRGAMELVDLPHAEFAQRSPLSLSGGQRRRAAIAGVLAMDPEVVILDEPTAGLDPRARGALVDILRHLHQRGTSLILITHDMDLVAELAGHTIVLRSGTVAISGSTREVLADPAFAAVSGLEPPPAVALMRSLNSLGCAVPEDLICLEEVLQFVVQRFTGGG